MYKKLLTICLLLFTVVLLTSCATLPFGDRLECTKYCSEKYCTAIDGNWKIIHSGCIYRCSRECEFCRNKMVKEWEKSKENNNEKK